MQSNDFTTLKRNQLDSRLKPLLQLRALSSPDGGWLKAIRTAVGMTAVQFGHRLNVTKQGALDMERREGDESITIAKLRRAAAALDCELVIAVLPKTTLDDSVRARARAKALEEQYGLVHTMRLEAQHAGVKESLNLAEDERAWLTTRLAHLWD